jgi:hypothetical protein
MKRLAPDRKVDVRRGAVTILLAGAALLAGLTIGAALLVTHLYAEHRGFAGAIDPRLIDLGSVVANVALLFGLFSLGAFTRDSTGRTEDDA